MYTDGCLKAKNCKVFLDVFNFIESETVASMYCSAVAMQLL
jgi:hypothetical protein